MYLVRDDVSNVYKPFSTEQELALDTLFRELLKTEVAERDIARLILPVNNPARDLRARIISAQDLSKLRSDDVKKKFMAYRLDLQAARQRCMGALSTINDCKLPSNPPPFALIPEWPYDVSVKTVVMVDGKESPITDALIADLTQARAPANFDSLSPNVVDLLSAVKPSAPEAKHAAIALKVVGRGYPVGHFEFHVPRCEWQGAANVDVWYAAQTVTLQFDDDDKTKQPTAHYVTLFDSDRSKQSAKPDTGTKYFEARYNMTMNPQGVCRYYDGGIQYWRYTRMQNSNTPTSSYLVLSDRLGGTRRFKFAEGDWLIHTLHTQNRDVPVSYYFLSHRATTNFLPIPIEVFTEPAALLAH
jgi:hypothetical protein